MYQDTYIEYLAEILVSTWIIEFSITFKRFLKDPWELSVSYGQESTTYAITERGLPFYYQFM